MVKSKNKKETKKNSSKKKNEKKKGKKNSQVEPFENGSIVVIEDDLTSDKNAELEARKAYLEEARSQEAFD